MLKVSQQARRRGFPRQFRYVPLAVLTMGWAYRGVPVVRHSGIDITFVAAAAVTFQVLHAVVVVHRLRVPKAAGWVFVLFAVFAFGLAGASFSSYSAEKVLFLYTLTLLAAVAPSMIVRDRDDVRHLVATLGMFGLVAATLAMLGPDPTRGTDRLALGEGGPIELGRMGGMALVWIVASAWTQSAPRLLGYGIAAVPALYVLVFSASQGPVAGVVAAVAVVVLLTRSRRRLARVLVLACAVGTVGWAVLTSAGDQRTDRIVNFRGADVRTVMLTESADVIERTPLGIGWGDFDQHVPIFVPGGLIEYPHNLFVEVALEAGWIPGVALVAVAVIAVRRVRAVRDPVAVALLAMLTYWLVNVSVSSDINGNSIVFVMFAVAMSRRAMGQAVMSPSATSAAWIPAASTATPVC